MGKKSKGLDVLKMIAPFQDSLQEVLDQQAGILANGVKG